ncbi:MAG: hypothetical protein ABI224_09820 [Acetobacteraceae bacterium]
MSHATFARSVVVSDDSQGLPGIAMLTTAILFDSGSRLRSIGDQRFIVEADNLHCDEHNRRDWDPADPLAGLSSVICRVNSNGARDTRAGQRFGDGRTLLALLQKIQHASASNGVQFDDCAMGGYCGAFVKSIRCTINTAIDPDEHGRWQCDFTDGR